MAATTTATSTATATATAAAAIAPAPAPVPAANPNSMKSTWRSRDRSQWNFYQRAINMLNAFPPEDNIPRHAKTDPVPHVAQWSQHVWILSHALIAPLLHQLLHHAAVSLVGWSSVHAIVAGHLYMICLDRVLTKEVSILARLGTQHGYLDGDVHARDGVPDTAAGKVFWSMYKTLGARTVALMMLTYDASRPPLDAMSSLSFWAALPLKTGLYSVVLDLFFYVYHRAVHELGPLWQYHRTHHLTKHPNPLLAAYADQAQELIEMLILPLLTFATMRHVVAAPLGLPFGFGFYDWWFSTSYVMYTEIWGHSGVRVHLAAPNTLHWLLVAFDMELCVEDHDLHHRTGWRSSHNYGKQTRVWDRLFGTCTKRIESHEANVDYVHQARMPLF